MPKLIPLELSHQLSPNKLRQWSLVKLNLMKCLFSLIYSERIDHHELLDLNFAEWDDGRMPIIKAKYDRKGSMSFYSQLVVSLGLLATFPFAPSAYLGVGGLGSLAFGTLCFITSSPQSCKLFSVSRIKQINLSRPLGRRSAWGCSSNEKKFIKDNDNP